MGTRVIRHKRLDVSPYGEAWWGDDWWPIRYASRMSGIPHETIKSAATAGSIRAAVHPIEDDLIVVAADDVRAMWRNRNGRTA